MEQALFFVKQGINKRFSYCGEISLNVLVDNKPTSDQPNFGLLSDWAYYPMELIWAHYPGAYKPPYTVIRVQYILM